MYDPAVPQEAIPVVRVRDVTRAVAWYELLGFFRERGEPGAEFASMARGHARIFLSECEGDAPQDPVVCIRHSHLENVAAALGVEIEDAAAGRAIEVDDPDGNRFRISEAHD